jgi:acyl carrier protein
MKATSVAEIVHEIWGDVLDCNNIDEKSDFFALGGDSIMALNMMFEVSAAFDIEIPPGVLFDHSTLGEFTAFVGDSIAATKAEETSDRR